MGIGVRLGDNAGSYRVALDVQAERTELICGCHLNFVVATFPDIQLGLQQEREAAFDELHRLFERDVGGWGKQQVKMVRHDDEGVELESGFVALVLKVVQHQVCGLGDLEDATALCGDKGEEVGSCLLWSSAHAINIEEPGVKTP